MRAAQEHDLRERTGLSIEQTDAAAWLVTSVGTVGGARAMGLFASVAWNSKLPLLAWKIPGLPWLLDRSYAFVARNRYRLPGVAPWCDAHPEACEPRVD